MELFKTFVSASILFLLLTLMGWATIETPPTPIGIDYGRIVTMSAQELAIKTAEYNTFYQERAK